MGMLSGVELISQERQEHIVKHNRDVNFDQEVNSKGQLVYASVLLLNDGHDGAMGDEGYPLNWNEDVWLKMSSKPYKERLVIAGALIAAEIDRINNP
jgi:hypothetical protein